MAFLPDRNFESPHKRPAQVVALAILASLPFCRDSENENPAPVAQTKRHVQTETRRIITHTESEPEPEPVDSAAQNEPEYEVDNESYIEPAIDLIVPYVALSALSECITGNNEDVVCSNHSGSVDFSLMCYSLSEPDRPILEISHSTLEGGLPTREEWMDMVINGEYPQWNEVDTSRFVMAPGAWNWGELDQIDPNQIEDISMPYDDVAPGLEDLCDRATTWFDKDPGQWCTGENCEEKMQGSSEWVTDLNKSLDQLEPFEDTLDEDGWALTETTDSFTLGFQLNENTFIEIHPRPDEEGVSVDFKTAVENGFLVEMHQAETPDDLMEIISNAE